MSVAARASCDARLVVAAGDTFAVELPDGGFGIVRVACEHNEKFCEHFGVERCFTIVPSHRVFATRPMLADIVPSTLYLARMATNSKPALQLSTALVSTKPPRTFKLLGNVPPNEDEAVSFAGTLASWTDVLLQWQGERRHLYETYQPAKRTKRAPTWKADLAKLRLPRLHLPPKPTRAFTAHLQACLDNLLALEPPRPARVDAIVTATMRAINKTHREPGHRLETIQRESICDFFDNVQRISGGLVDIGALREF